ncbi:MAG TPA: hypothetical protein VKF36_17330 [Syntrophorhabdales bacterium]|nr:hypothetical protein [Syntrophorhabdales bacterium]
MKTAAHSFLALLLLFLAGCSGIGPGTVSRDRFDYTEAISDSWKRQMLFNMVKIRYGDAPVFMDVSSVISQYQIAGAINLGATITQQPSSSSQTLGASGTYVDRPTITFTPILGDKFARSLMSPIPPAAILSLIQGGYPADLVFRALVHEINGIRNRFGGDARARSAEPEFYTLIEKMRTIQLAGGIGMRVTKIDKEAAAVMVIRGKRDPEIEALSKEVRDMLGLDPLTTDINVVYGAIPRDNKEIALLTRSILEVLVDLSSDIEVPASDVQEKRVSPTFQEKAAGEKVHPLVRIQSSSEKPGDAFVSIPYRKSYFWIDDKDLRSKKIFSFLMFVFTLVETGEKGMAPIVTIPTG